MSDDLKALFEQAKAAAQTQETPPDSEQENLAALFEQAKQAVSNDDTRLLHTPELEDGLTVVVGTPRIDKVVPMPTPPAAPPQPLISGFDFGKAAAGAMDFAKKLPSMAMQAGKAYVDTELDRLNEFKERVLVPPAQAVGDAIVQAVREPILDAPIGENADVKELLTRRALQPALGEKWADKMPEENARRGVAALEDALGEAGATAAQAVTYGLGTVPGFFFNPVNTGVRAGQAAKAAVQAAPKVAALAQRSPLLGKVLTKGAEVAGRTAGGVVEGAAMGTFSTLGKEGERVEHGAAAGGVFGAAGHGVIALVTREGGAAMADELRKVSLPEPDTIREYSPLVKHPQGVQARPPTEASTSTPALSESAFAPTYVKANEKSFKPGIVSLETDETGSLVARFTEMNVNGAATTSAMPIRSYEDAQKYKQLMQKHGLTDYILTREAAEAAAKLPDYSFQMVMMQEPGEKLLRGAGKSRAETVSAKRPVAVITKDSGVSASPDLDAPPPGIKQAPVAVVVDETGAVRLQAAEPKTGEMDIADELKIFGPVPSGAAGKLPQKDIDAVFDAYLRNEPDIRMPNIHVAQNSQLLPPTIPAAPAVKAGQLPAHDVEDVSHIINLVQATQKSARPGVMDRLWKHLLPTHLRFSRDLNQRILQAQAAKNMENVDSTFRALRKLLPDKKLWSDFDLDVGKLAAGRMTSDDMAARHPDVWPRVRKTFDKLLEESMELDRRIAALGGIPSDLISLRDAGRIDQYVARVYRAHYLPKGRWAEMVPRDVISDAVKFLIAEHKKVGRAWTDAAIAREVNNILNAPDPVEAFAASKLPLPSWKNLLKRNDKIPLPIRRLLGEETSGTVRVAMSLAKQRAIAANLTLWQDVTSNPQYFSRTPTVEHTVEVPDNKRLFGHAAGGYVRPEMAELVHAPKAIDAPFGVWQAFGGLVKGFQVALGGPRQWMNALMGNWMYSVYAGGIQLLRPMHTARYFRLAWLAMREFRRDGGGIGNLLLEARQFGVDIPGLVASEVTGPQSKVARELERIIKSGGDAHSMLHRMGEYITTARDKALSGYDLIDRMFKLANYIALRQKFLKKGMALEDAAREAAYRVNISFPNPQAPVPLAQTIRKTPFSLLAPYATYAMEDVRIHAQLASRIAKGEWDLPLRMAAHAAALYGIFGNKGLLGMWRRDNGVTDEEVEAALALRKDSGAAYRPLMVAMPWGDVKDGKMVPHFYDFTPWIGPARFLTGHPSDSIFKKVLGNFLKLPFAGGVTEEAVDAWLTKAGIRRDMTYEQRVLPGEEGVVRVLMDAAKKGAIPGVINEAREIARRTGNSVLPGDTLRRTEEPMSGFSAAQRAAGAPIVGTVSVPGVTPGDSPAAFGKMREFRGQMRDYKGMIRSVMQSTRPDAEKKRLVEAIREQQLADMKRFGEASDKVEAAQQKENTP